jgi:hypothetical protein
MFFSGHSLLFRVALFFSLHYSITPIALVLATILSHKIKPFASSMSQARKCCAKLHWWEHCVQNQNRRAYSVYIHVVLISRGSDAVPVARFILTLSQTAEPHNFHASKMMRRLAVKN